MKRQLIVVLVAVFASLGALTATQAVENGKQKPLEVALELGNTNGELVMAPGGLALQKAQPYKLVLSNPSNTTHYLLVSELATAVQTSEINVRGGEIIRTARQSARATLIPAVAKRSFNVKTIEVWPGGTAEWTFTPVQTGSYKIGCEIAAHADAGMGADIQVN